jgi:hypothetical protein
MNCSTLGSEICDQTDFQCRGCEANTECESRLCGNVDGICANKDDLLYVQEGAGATDCSWEAPCGSISRAIGFVTPTLDTIIVGAGSYVQPVSVTTETVTLLADGDVTLNPALTGSQSAIVVTGTANMTVVGIKIIPASGVATTDGVECAAGATLTLRDVEVSNAVDDGVTASQCTVTITGSTVSGNGGAGVRQSNGTLNLTDSTISANGGGGVVAISCDYTVRNNFIVDNAADGATAGFLAQSTEAKTETLEFNTFARNSRAAASGHAVSCVASNLVARNNVYMLAEGSTAALDFGCAHEFCMFDTDDSVAPIGVNNNASLNATFVDADSGNYHLMAGSPGINAADPAATLATDIDGEARPQGGRHDMGADEAE